jgi:hypothetical protein
LGGRFFTISHHFLSFIITFLDVFVLFFDLLTCFGWGFCMFRWREWHLIFR